MQEGQAPTASVLAFAFLAARGDGTLPHQPLHPVGCDPEGRGDERGFDDKLVPDTLDGGHRRYLQ